MTDADGDDRRVVFESINRAACQDRALVLAAAEIPHQVLFDGNVALIVVAAADSARAAAELHAYEEENPPPVAKPRAKPLPSYNATPGIVAYVVVVLGVAMLAGTGAFGRNWYAAGAVDGELIRNGEWWRTITALTLHSGPSHIAGNLAFGGLFGLFAGRLLGSGFSWAATLVAAISANFANTLLLESAHRSIGASTAVFAMLGVLSGYVFRARLMSQERWYYRYGPVIGGFALLMYTGTGDDNTDVGAHLLGFLCGMLVGALLKAPARQAGDMRLQRIAGIGALVTIAAAWAIALGG